MTQLDGGGGEGGEGGVRDRPQEPRVNKRNEFFLLKKKRSCCEDSTPIAQSAVSSVHSGQYTITGREAEGGGQVAALRGSAFTIGGTVQSHTELCSAQASVMAHAARRRRCQQLPTFPQAVLSPQGLSDERKHENGRHSTPSFVFSFRIWGSVCVCVCN